MGNNLIEGIKNLIEFRESLEENEYAYSMELESARNKGINLQKYFKKNYACNKQAGSQNSAGMLNKRYLDFSRKETFDKMIEKWLTFYDVKYEPKDLKEPARTDSFKATYSEYRAVQKLYDNIESIPKIMPALFVPGFFICFITLIIFLACGVASSDYAENDGSGFMLGMLICSLLAPAGIVPLVLSLTLPNKRRNAIIHKERELYEAVVREYEIAYNHILRKIALIENELNKDITADIDKEYQLTKEEAYNLYINSYNTVQPDVAKQILEMDKTAFDCFKSNYKNIETNMDLHNLCEKCKAISKQANNSDAIELIKARKEALKMLSNVRSQVQLTTNYSTPNFNTNYNFNDVKNNLFEDTKKVEEKPQVNVNYSFDDIKNNMFDDNKKQEEKPKASSGNSLYCITCDNKDKCTHVGNPEGFCYK